MKRPVANGGTFSYRVGEVEVTVVHDGILTFPRPPDFIRDIPDEDVAAALRAADWPDNVLTTSFAPVLLRGSSGTTLIDTGFGPDQGTKSGATNGLLVENMKAAGIDPASVDRVVISHFHGDHVNGLLSSTGPTFQNARVLVPEPEWLYWMSDEEKAKMPAGRVADMFMNNRRVFGPLRDRVETFAWGDEVVAGLTAVGAPGHSIGHTCFGLHSEGEDLFLQIDLTNHVPFGLPHPTWNSVFDQFPEQAAATRLRLYDQLAESGVPVQAFHHPFPGRSRIVKRGRGYALQPIEV